MAVKKYDPGKHGDAPQWVSDEAYGRAYGEQIRKGGLTSRQNLGVSKAEWKAAQPKSTFNFPFGGGGGRNVGYAQEDYDRQMALMDKIARMTAPWSTTGTLGTTDVDYEGKMITQKLSPELQAQYDALLARSGLSGQQVAAMGADPYQMQQYLYDQNLALKQPAQADLRKQTMEALQAKGMLGSTGGAGLYGSVEESIQRSNAQDFADAMAQSQSMMDMERGRGQQDLSTAMAMGGAQVPFMESGRMYGQGTSIGNVEGVSGASRNIFGQQAAKSMGKAKQKQGIWDMLLGGGGGGFLGGLFGQEIKNGKLWLWRFKWNVWR